MSDGRPVSAFDPHRFSSNGFLIKPEILSRYYFRTNNLQEPQIISPKSVTAYRLNTKWVALIAGIIITVIVATLIVVLAVVLTRQSQKANEVSQTSSTAQTPSSNMAQMVGISSPTSTTAQTSNSTVPQLIGNFTILGKTLGEVSSTSICNYITEQMTKSNQTTTYCRITDLRSGSVRVGYELGILKRLNEDDRRALNRASTAIALGLSADDSVFQVDLNTITFENEQGSGAENNCLYGTECRDENAQCVSVVDGYVCVNKTYFTSPGNNINENGVTPYYSSSLTPFSPVGCTDNTWVKISGGYANSRFYQPGITSPAACQSRCLESSTCQGIMWYTGSVQGCYLATQYSVSYGYGSYYIYYSLIRNQSNCDLNDTCIYVWIAMENRQAIGAVRNLNISNLNDCIASCQNNSNCSAVDWDSSQSYCWHFLNTNESRLTRYYPYIYHFNKECIDPQATTTTLSMPSTSPSVCASWFVKYCEPTKQCLSSSQICDKYQDCPNDIDETNCTCDSNHYQCKNGRCIYRSWLCDGVEDCPLKDDESSPQCGACDSSQFLCGKTHTCISKSQQCDGISNCSDSEDEVNCLRLAGNGTTSGSNASTQLVNVTYRGVSNYFICSENWNESWSDSVCQHLGYRKSYATAFRTVSRPASFLALNLSVSSSNLLAHLQTSQCSSNQAVSVSCIPSECGTRADVPPDGFGPYIINGQRAKRGAWPWQVLFEVGVYSSNNISDFTWYSYCGGSLINDRWILTAAHCTIAPAGLGYEGQVRPSNVRIQLGSLSRLGDNDTVYARVDQVYTHPSYSDSPVTDNDVGLVRLSEPVNFTDTIRPICLPTPTEDLSKFRVCVDTGFGRTILGATSNYLLQARMNIVPYKDCYYYVDYYLRGQTQICIGTLPTENDNNICSGDSGGPFACEDYTGAWKVIGVNSYVINNIYISGRCSRSIVARVTVYAQWIQQTIAANSV